MENNGQDKSVSENWTFTYLKSLTHHRAEEHDAGSSFAYSLNKDGSIVGELPPLNKIVPQLKNQMITASHVLLYGITLLANR